MSQPFILVSDHHLACSRAWGHGFMWGAGVAAFSIVSGAMALWFA